MTLDFEADTRPLRDALADLLDAFPSGEMPSASSTAMREISQESQWTDSAPWGNPVQFAHSLAAIQTHMAVDHCRAYLLLVEADPPVTFGVAPPARAAIEAFGRALALYEAPTLTDRVVIAMNDRLETLYQQDRLPGSVVGDADPQQRAEQLLAQADTQFGLKIVSDRWKWIGARRASSTEVVRALLDRWEEHIGRVAYNFLSAVDHALGHGINQFTKPVPRSAFDIYGRTEIVLFGNLVNTVTASLILAAHAVLHAQGSHRGRDRGPWEEISRVSVQAVVGWLDRTGHLSVSPSAIVDAAQPLQSYRGSET